MTKLITYSLLVVFAAFGCRPLEPIILPILSANQAAIPLNESARFAPDLVVQVTDIFDSRCPQDVVCILAGTASVKLSITNISAVQDVHLQLDSPTLTHRVDSIGVTFAGESYKVILRDVVPYPNMSKRLSPKQAIIQITKI